MNKKIILILSILIAGCFAIPVDAHLWKSDGAMTVLFHISPDDDPVIGQPATLHFGFNDFDNKFNPNECNCVVTISLDNIQLLQEEVMPIIDGKPTIYARHLPFIFAKKGIYTITIQGTPMTPSAFQPFQIQYDIRVDKEGNPTTPTSTFPLISMVYSIIILTIIAVIV